MSTALPGTGPATTPLLTDGKPSLHKKLAEIAATVGRIEKRGWNDFHKYHYAMEADIVEAVRAELSSRFITLTPSLTELRHEGTLSTAFIKFTFTDGETGEAHSFDWAGTGEDKGDKGTYKAFTGAYKYALMKFFLIPTGDDPEADTETDKRAAGKAGAARGAPRSTPSTGASDRPACPKCGKTEWVLEAVKGRPGTYFCWYNAEKMKLGCGHTWSTSGANGAGQPTQEPARAGAAKPSGSPPLDFKARFLAIGHANSYRRPETQLRLANSIRKLINLEPLETLDAPDIAWEAMCVALEARAEFKKPGGAGAAGTSSAGNAEPVSAEVH